MNLTLTALGLLCLIGGICFILAYNSLEKKSALSMKLVSTGIILIIAGAVLFIKSFNS
jgi:uncharacterized membrane protein HdeD (DUF308 family)